MWKLWWPRFSIIKQVWSWHCYFFWRDQSHLFIRIQHLWRHRRKSPPRPRTNGWAVTSYGTAWRELGMGMRHCSLESITMKAMLINAQVKQTLVMKTILEENQTNLGTASEGPPDAERGIWRSMGLQDVCSNLIICASLTISYSVSSLNISNLPLKSYLLSRFSVRPLLLLDPQSHRSPHWKDKQGPEKPGRDRKCQPEWDQITIWRLWFKLSCSGKSCAAFDALGTPQRAKSFVNIYF